MVAAISRSSNLEDWTAPAVKTLTLPRGDSSAAPDGRPASADQGGSAVFFDENALAADWREQVLHCRDNGVSINRDIAFAIAVADLLSRA